MVDGLERRPNALVLPLHKRLFIETECDQSAARWVEIAMADDFLNRFAALHRVHMAEKLYKIEAKVNVAWRVLDGWVMEPESIMGMYEDFAYFEAYAAPMGLVQPSLAHRKKVSALLFYGSAKEFIELNRTCSGDEPTDEIMANPSEFGLNREHYRESTIRAMQEDQENDFISCVNLHLLKSDQAVLRLATTFPTICKRQKC